MKHAAWIALVLMLLCPQVGRSQGADLGRRQAAEELARLMYAVESRSDFVGSIIDSSIRSNPNLELHRDVVLEWVRKLVSWEAIGPSLVDLYAREFSEEELRNILAFYKTPTGQKVLERLPSMLSGTTGMGLALAKEKREELEQLILADLQGEGGEKLRAHADRLYDQEKWAEARDAYVRYLKANPKQVDVISDLGVCYRALGDLQNAVKELDRALSIDPSHFPALYNKIIVLGYDLNRKPEARELLVKLRTLQPENEQVDRLAEALKAD